MFTSSKVLFFFVLLSTTIDFNASVKQTRSIKESENRSPQNLGLILQKFPITWLPDETLWLGSRIEILNPGQPADVLKFLKDVQGNLDSIEDERRALKEFREFYPDFVGEVRNLREIIPSFIELSSQDSCSVNWVKSLLIAAQHLYGGVVEILGPNENILYGEKYVPSSYKKLYNYLREGLRSYILKCIDNMAQSYKFNQVPDLDRILMVGQLQPISIDPSKLTINRMARPEQKGDFDRICNKVSNELESSAGIYALAEAFVPTDLAKMRLAQDISRANNYYRLCNQWNVHRSGPIRVV